MSVDYRVFLSTKIFRASIPISIRWISHASLLRSEEILWKMWHCTVLIISIRADTENPFAADTENPSSGRIPKTTGGYRKTFFRYPPGHLKFNIPCTTISLRYPVSASSLALIPQIFAIILRSHSKPKSSRKSAPIMLWRPVWGVKNIWDQV